MARPGNSLVGLLAQESQYRNHGRTSDLDLHAAVAPAECETRKRPRILAVGAQVAAARYREYNSLFTGRAPALDRVREAGDASAALHRVSRSGGWFLVG